MPEKIYNITTPEGRAELIAYLEAEIREWEGLSAFATDPTEARKHLDIARDRLDLLKKWQKELHHA